MAPTAAAGAKLLVADPALLALPPLAPDERMRATGEREARALTAELPAAGPGRNLFGVHDIRGRGTHVEPCPHADPFIMCVAAKLPPGVHPPFCAHPHCGTAVATLLFSGGAILPWDNVQGREAEPLLPGGLYHVDTGAGCVHDEPTEPIDLRPRTEAGFGDDAQPPALPAPGAPTALLQLWWNAIDSHAPDGAPLRPVVSQVVSPASVPRVVQPDGVSVRLLAGGYRDAPDVLTSSTHPVRLLHVRLEPGAAGALSPLPAEFNGFAWMLDGAAHIGGGEGGVGGEGCGGGEAGEAVLAAQGAKGLVLLPPGGDSLRLRNASGEGACSLFIALGLPHRRPHYKYVGYGGGLVHRSVAEVEAAMAEYEAAPKDFGRAAAAAAAAAAGRGSLAAVDMSRYVLVPGFMSEGGDMMERPADAVARFTYAE